MQNTSYSSEEISLISDIAGSHEWECFLVGGYVRDLLLGRETGDIDLAVKGDARAIAHIIAEEIRGKYVLLDDENKVARVVLKRGNSQVYLDFSSYSENIEEDLARRDFTINAMALDINNIDKKNIVDPHGGMEDLENRLVKAVKNDVFKQDPVRLLRAVRFKYLLDFNISLPTEKLITKNSKLAAKVAGEKTREELLAILGLPSAYSALCYMETLSLLTAIIPELKELKGIQQPKEHYWDVFSHSLQTVACTELLLRENVWEYDHGGILTSFTPWDETIKAHFDQNIGAGSNHRQLLKLAALLHDIAKPACKTVEDSGRIRFLGHTKEGAAVSINILNRLRFSNREIRAVELMVYNHLRPAQMSNEGMPTSHAVYRFFRDTEDYGLDVLFLELADFLASQGPKLYMIEWQAHTDLAKYVLNEHREQDTENRTTRLLNGNDLMDILGLSPGPELGELLSYLDEAQATGTIKSRQEAIEMAKKKIEKADSGT